MNNSTKYNFPTRNFSAGASRATTMNERCSNGLDKGDLQDLQNTVHRMDGEKDPHSNVKFEFESVES